MCLAWIKILKGWSLILVFFGVPLLTPWSLLVGMLFPLGLAWWEVSSLMTVEISLSLFGVTCNCFDMSSIWLWRFYFLGKLPHLTCRKLLKINITIIYGFGDKVLILLQITRIYLCARYLQFLLVLGKRHLNLNCFYHSLTDLFPCLKLVRRSHLTLSLFVCGLQKSSYLDHITSKLKSPSGKHHDPYWSIPKSPLHTMTFLHFFAFSNMASSQSRIFSHFSFHLRNLWYMLSFTVQSILGPSIEGINMGCTNDCDWLVDAGKCCALCTSISWSELKKSCNIIGVSWLTLVSITQAEFLVALGILGLWILGHRPLSSRYNKIKQYISGTSWNKLVKLQITVITLETLDVTWAEYGKLYSSLWDSGNLTLWPHPHETWKVPTCASCKQT